MQNRKILIGSIISLFLIQACVFICSVHAQDTHFVPVWGPNAYQPMNIYVVEAILLNLDLEPEDEIAVFDDSICVGVAAVGETAPCESDPLPIVVSKDDGSGNGFAEGDSIIFKVWDADSSREIDVHNNYLQYYDPSTGEKIAPCTFEGLGSAAVGFNIITEVFFSNLTANLMDDSIELRWKIGYDSEDIEGFRVLRRSHGEFYAEISNGLLEPYTRSYIDSKVRTGKDYNYAVEAITRQGEVISSQEVAVVLPYYNFKLLNNFPNPFNPATTIAYELPERSKVVLQVFDINGKLVRTLINSLVEEGYGEVVWNGKDQSGRSVSSGVYFYKLRAGKTMISRKAVLLR